MSRMIFGCEHFNANIEMLQVVRVTTMHRMLYQAKSFNQLSISQWCVGNTMDMTAIFFDAKRFTHDL